MGDRLETENLPYSHSGDKYFEQLPHAGFPAMRSTLSIWQPCNCFRNRETHHSLYFDMSYSLDSLKGGYIGDNIGEYHRGY